MGFSFVVEQKSCEESFERRSGRVMEEKLEGMREDVSGTAGENMKTKRKGIPLKFKILLLIIVPLMIASVIMLLEVVSAVKGVGQPDLVRKVFLYISITMVITTIVSCFVCRIVIWDFVQSLNRTIDVLNTAAGGDLTKEISKADLARSDEMGVLANRVSEVILSLRKLIIKVGNTSDLVLESASRLEKMSADTSSISDEVANSMSEMANSATNQAMETQLVSDAVRKIGDGIEETSTAVQALMSNAETMKKNGASGVEIVSDLENISQKVKTQIAIIYEQTNTTNESAQSIHKATELIASIANETNLLALNASIEAARAGESGRGFAVVAEQIKNLAEQSKQSTKSIEDIINNLLQESQQAVKTMNTVDAIIGLQADKVETTKSVFESVNNELLATMSEIETIAKNTSVLEEAKEQVVGSIENLSSIAEANAAASQETAAASEQLAATIDHVRDATLKLNNASEELISEMNMFQVY